MAAGLNTSRIHWLSTALDKYIKDRFAVVRNFHTLVGRLGFSSKVPRHLKPMLGPPPLLLGIRTATWLGHAPTRWACPHTHLAKEGS